MEEFTTYNVVYFLIKATLSLLLHPCFGLLHSVKNLDNRYLHYASSIQSTQYLVYLWYDSLGFLRKVQNNCNQKYILTINIKRFCATTSTINTSDAHIVFTI